MKVLFVVPMQLSKQDLIGKLLRHRCLQRVVWNPNYRANIRSTDNKVLGVVTDRYQVVQNREAFDFTDAMIGGGCQYETAGSLFGGKKIFFLAKTDTATILDDEVEPYMCFTNNHDGLVAFVVV